ncbi:hypothetical protein KHS38_07165 [Mucilaginibacter sp. Bleaf8]|uniref:hypothetical protein n=1 Tax=Mucilaginibacter sp. Bleaf8 TaxID=2834430 RepID=UPI001BCC1221|nr:hypothetical protein [Mucilaginibacter sp. Bleaf8]MBS7564181.1 hypothetical protein [Mucilaginibacter sp. Bleaf8]
MANSVIDTKTDKHTFGVWPVKETVTTTLSLILTGPDTFGLNYQAQYSGIKSGTVSGGPYAVSGNGSFVVNDNPKVTVTISNYSDSGSYISMHIQITVDIPVIGTETIFDETLGGPYGSNNLNEIVNHISTLKAS